MGKEVTEAGGIEAIVHRYFQYVEEDYELSPPDKTAVVIQGSSFFIEIAEQQGLLQVAEKVRQQYLLHYQELAKNYAGAVPYKEAAQRLGVRGPIVKRLISSGKLQAAPVGPCYVTQESLEEMTRFMQTHRLFSNFANEQGETFGINQSTLRNPLRKHLINIGGELQAAVLVYENSKEQQLLQIVKRARRYVPLDILSDELDVSDAEVARRIQALGLKLTTKRIKGSQVPVLMASQAELVKQYQG